MGETSVSIEGVEGKAKDMNAILDFVDLFRQADEFILEKDGQYCWYD